LNTLKLEAKNPVTILITLVALFSLLLTVNLILFFKPVGSNTEKYSGGFISKPEATFNLEIPSKLDFAGEPVPLQNFDVKESFDREFLVNAYWQSNTILVLKRANRFFPIIAPILKKNGIPEDFKYLSVIESSLTNSGSTAGAVGFWQFIKRTAKQYKLEVNDQVDERYHVEKATQAACDYFKESYRVYHNWTLVAASYDVGRGAINSQLKSQKASNYYDMYLNNETARYVFRIVATKEIFNNPGKYGYHIEDQDMYPQIPFSWVQVDTSINNLPAFAHKFGVNYKLFKLFNPWIRDKRLFNKTKKTYFIKIPKPGDLRVFDINVQQLDSLTKSVLRDTTKEDNQDN